MRETSSTHQTRPTDDFTSPRGSAAEAVQAVVRIIKMLRYRKTIVLATLSVAISIGVLYLATATPRYEARGSLLVIPTGADMWSASTNLDRSRQALIPTYERLFYEDVVLHEASRRLQRNTSVIRAMQGTPTDGWPAVLRSNLSAQRVRHTNLMEVSYRAISAAAAQAIVDAVIQSYLQFMDRNHRDASGEIVRILENERVDIEQTLATRQRELLALKRQAGDLGLSRDSQNVHPAVQRVLRLNESLIQVQQKRLQLQSTGAALQRALNDKQPLQPLLSQVEPLIGREFLLVGLGLNPQQLEARSRVEQRLAEHRARLEKISRHFGPAHPDVIELQGIIRQEQVALVNFGPTLQEQLSGVTPQALGTMLAATVNQQLRQVSEQESALSREYARAEQQALALNDRIAEMSIAENDVQRLRHLHDTLLNRIAGIDINQDQADVRVTVVTSPVAGANPVSPRLPWVLIGCLAGGLALGACIAYVLDLLDDRFQSPEEMHLQLDLPVLTTIGNLVDESADAGFESILSVRQPNSTASESLRTLRTALRFSRHDTQCLAIASTEPGDGKTTVLCSLGATFAVAGKRTLLIDADLRRPGLSRLLNLRGGRGLAQLLETEAAPLSLAPAIVSKTPLEQLDAIGCGHKTADPGALLGSPRFAELLAWASDQYDQVLIDCPPVMAASDAAIIGRQADSLLMVIQPDKNHRRMVLRATESLKTLNVPLAGIVANRVAEQVGSDYYGLGYNTSDGDESDDLESPINDDNAFGAESQSARREARPTVRRYRPAA